MVLVEVVREVPKESHCSKRDVEILCLGAELSRCVHCEGQTVVRGERQEVGEDQLKWVIDNAWKLNQDLPVVGTDLMLRQYLTPP